MGQKSSVISGVQIQEIRERDLQISPPLQLLLWETLRPISTGGRGTPRCKVSVVLTPTLLHVQLRTQSLVYGARCMCPFALIIGKTKTASFTTPKQYLAKNSKAWLGFFLSYSSRPPCKHHCLNSGIFSSYISESR